VETEKQAELFLLQKINCMLTYCKTIEMTLLKSYAIASQMFFPVKKTSIGLRGFHHLLIKCSTTEMSD